MHLSILMSAREDIWLENLELILFHLYSMFHSFLMK